MFETTGNSFTVPVPGIMVPVPVVYDDDHDDDDREDESFKRDDMERVFFAIPVESVLFLQSDHCAAGVACKLTVGGMLYISS